MFKAAEISSCGKCLAGKQLFSKELFRPRVEINFVILLKSSLTLARKRFAVCAEVLYLICASESGRELKATLAFSLMHGASVLAESPANCCSLANLGRLQGWSALLGQHCA
jgi:hypothetical protein